MRPAPADEFLIRQLDIGWTVWERMPDDADYDPRGGTVVGWDDRPDPDTGEVIRHYRLLRFPQGLPDYFSLSELECNAKSMGLPNAAFIRPAVKRLSEVVARSKGMFTSEIVTHQQVAMRLTEAMA